MTTFDILQWNIQGYKAKYEEFLLLKESKPAALCLQESMVGDAVLNPPRDYHLEAYSPIVAPVPGAGLLTFIRNDVPFREVPLNTMIQAKAYRVKFRKEVTLCNLYLKHNQHLSVDDWKRFADQLPTPFIILGDFNAKNPMWGGDEYNERGRVLQDFLAQYQACIMNDGRLTHVHVQTATFSAIDLAVVSPEILMEYTWDVADCPRGSDHFPIKLLDKSQIPYLTQSRYITARADWSLFKALTHVEAERRYVEVDDFLERFHNAVEAAAQQSIPVSKGTGRKQVPWWNAQCMLADRERKKALRRYQRTRSVADKISYNRERAKVRLVKRRARRNSWRQYVSTINSNTSMSKVWKHINKIKGKYTMTQSPCLAHGGRIEMDQQQVATILAEHYHSVSSNNNSEPTFMRIKQLEESQPIDFLSNDHQDYNEPITLNEFKSALSQCRNTAPGLDGINYEMIRNLNDSATNLLLTLYNRVWLEEIFPDCWGKAIVLPFLKKEKPPTEAESYRPIALTSCVCKLLERIVNNRLQYVLEKGDILSEAQLGFRKLRGTEDAHVILQTGILNAFALRQELYAVFFDLKKAYDTTWRYGILKAVHACGIRGKLAIFICNFLRSRHFQVRVNNSSSAFYEQEQGVPQGSVLSCSLFALAINGICSNLPRNVKASLYVDDLLIFTMGTYVPAVERRLQHAIDRIDNWTTEHGFTISTDKTVAMQFHRKRGLLMEPSLKIKNQNISFVQEKKFLGLFYDQKLQWQAQIEHLRRKCTKALDILKVLSHSDWGADRTAMLRVYRSLIRSKIDFGCQVYQSAKLQVLKRLDPVHNMAIRLCTGAFRSSPVDSLYCDSGEPPLSIRRMQITLQHFVRIQRLSNSATYKTVFEPEVEDAYEHNDKLSLPFGVMAKRHCRTLGLPRMKVTSVSFPEEPPWKLDISFCRALCTYTKATTHPELMRMLFMEHLQAEHSDCIHIYTDGSKSDGNVGCAAFSAEATMKQKLHPQTSIFSAELYAIIAALEIIEGNRHGRYFAIISDSRSSLHAIEKPKVDHPLISAIQSWLIRLSSRQKNVYFCWTPSHVSISGNENADKEAKAASVDQNVQIHNSVPHRDLYALIKSKLKWKWQQDWQNVDRITGRMNKLRRIKDTVSFWPSSCSKNRRYEVVLSRLRIGHSLLTHGHLMEGRPAPYCEDCIVPLTIKHILAECPSYHQERRRFFNIDPAMQDFDIILGYILGDRTDFNIDSIMQFLISVNLYGKI